MYRSRYSASFLAFVLSPLLVALTTVALRVMQVWLIVHLGAGQSRVFTTFFYITIAVITLLGGRGAGFWTLGLSLFATDYYIMFPRHTLGDKSIVDTIQLCLLAIVGAVIVEGVEAQRKNRRLLTASEEAQARLRTVMDTAPVGVMLEDMDGAVSYTNQEAERILGQSISATLHYHILEPDGSVMPPAQTAIARALAGEAAVVQSENLIEQPDGNRLWVETRSTLVVDRNGHRLGGLTILNDISERKASEESIHTLLTQVEAKAKREELLNKIGQSVLEAQNPDAVLAITTESLGATLNADRCYYVTYDLAQDSGQVGPEWHRDGLDSISGLYTMSDLGINRDRNYLSGQTQVVSDTYETEKEPGVCVDRLGLRALLRVPVQHGAIMTVLAVSMTEPRDWLPEEITLVETVASQTRVAVESLRLQQREHNIATALQTALMPVLPEGVPGLDLAAYYRPALEESSLGGDFHDVFPLDKGLFALVVGDVSGKGLAAASQVATVRQMLRYALYLSVSHGQSPAEAVTELNRQMVAHDLLSGFVTLFVGIYDSAGSSLAYVSCGQEPALLRHDTGMVEELAPTGPVMGMDMNAVYANGSVTLGPGETLAIYTDGLSEAGRNRRELLGVEGIARLMQDAPHGTASAQVAHLVAGMNAHAHDSLHDDVCLLVVLAQSLSVTPSF